MGADEGQDRDDDVERHALRHGQPSAVQGPIRATEQVVAGAVRWTDRDLLDHQVTVTEAVFASADAQEGARAFAREARPRLARRLSCAE